MIDYQVIRLYVFHPGQDKRARDIVLIGTSFHILRNTFLKPPYVSPFTSADRYRYPFRGQRHTVFQIDLSSFLSRIAHPAASSQTSDSWHVSASRFVSCGASSNSPFHCVLLLISLENHPCLRGNRSTRRVEVPYPGSEYSYTRTRRELTISLAAGTGQTGG
jgi:hypothetical protein